MVKSVQQLLETLEARGMRQELELQCRRLGVTLDGVLSQSASSAHVRARGILYVTLKARYGYSTSEIGRLFNRDHSTVAASMRKWGPRLDEPAAPLSPSSRLFSIAERSSTCHCGSPVLHTILAGDGQEYESLTLRDLGLEPQPGRTVRITAEYVETT